MRSFVYLRSTGGVIAIAPYLHGAHWQAERPRNNNVAGLMDRRAATLLNCHSGFRPQPDLNQTADGLGITPYRWRTSLKPADYTQRARPSVKYALFGLWLSLKDQDQSVPVISV